MAIPNQIQESVQRLPEAFQVEVLDFVEYLLAKAEREALRQEELAWSNLSMAAAMRDIEDEDASLYTLSDVKVMFR